MVWCQADTIAKWQWLEYWIWKFISLEHQALQFVFLQIHELDEYVMFIYFGVDAENSVSGILLNEKAAWDKELARKQALADTNNKNVKTNTIADTFNAYLVT